MKLKPLVTISPKFDMIKITMTMVFTDVFTIASSVDRAKPVDVKNYGFKSDQIAIILPHGLYYKAGDDIFSDKSINEMFDAEVTNIMIMIREKAKSRGMRLPDRVEFIVTDISQYDSSNPQAKEVNLK